MGGQKVSAENQQYAVSEEINFNIVSINDIANLFVANSEQITQANADLSSIAIE